MTLRLELEQRAAGGKWKPPKDLPVPTKAQARLPNVAVTPQERSAGHLSDVQLARADYQPHLFNHNNLQK